MSVICTLMYGMCLYSLLYNTNSTVYVCSGFGRLICLLCTCNVPYVGRFIPAKRNRREETVARCSEDARVPFWLCGTQTGYSVWVAFGQGHRKPRRTGVRCVWEAAVVADIGSVLAHMHGVPVCQPLDYVCACRHGLLYVASILAEHC